MSHRRTWGVVGLDGQQHLQVRLLAQCGDKIKYVYEYDMMTYLLIYWLLLSSTQPQEHSPSLAVRIHRHGGLTGSTHQEPLRCAQKPKFFN